MTTNDKITETMNALESIEGVSVELCGTWLWIDGSTYEVKERLKKLGCKWSRNKKRWYWHDPENKGWSNGKAHMSDIRLKYGSAWVKREEKAMA